MFWFFIKIKLLEHGPSNNTSKKKLLGPQRVNDRRSFNTKLNYQSTLLFHQMYVLSGFKTFCQIHFLRLIFVFSFASSLKLFLNVVKFGIVMHTYQPL